MNPTFFKNNLFALFLIAASFFQMQSVFGQNQPSKVISFTLKLKKKADTKIGIAKLKYNKHLAYSFTVDDGYRSAFACAFPLFNGGKISGPIPDEWQNDQGGDGSVSEGLFFSDGCANKIPFKLSLAINAGAISDLPENRGHLSWTEVNTLYNAGWDLLNHGLFHRTKKGTDFQAEVTENVVLTKKNTGFIMSQFVVPGGEHEPGYEHDYEKFAFDDHHFAVASYQGNGPVIAVQDKVDLDRMIYARHFLQNAKEPDAFSLSKKNLITLDSIMKVPQPIWYNEFTHGVGNSNLWGLSLFFPEFKYYMTQIAARYGSNGSDKIWMAPWQEVYEYLWLRDRIKVSYVQKGRNILVKVALPEMPKTFRYKSFSLTVATASKFRVLSSPSSASIVSDGQSTHQLINVVLP